MRYKGYGYAMGDRRGRGIGSHSNGYGKSSLSASVLWALTGSFDTHPLLQDARVYDVSKNVCKALMERTSLLGP